MTAASAMTPMTAWAALAAAFHCELRKFARSRVGVLGTAVIAGGILTITAGISGALAGGNPALAAKLGPTATPDWLGLLTVVAQITGAGGLLGFGTVLAWMFAREFADGTVVGLFALPVSRAQTAAAKLAVYGGWLVVLNALLVMGLLVLGVLLGHGLPDAAARSGIGRQFLLGLLTGLIALPVAWVATVSRSLLGGVSTAIGLVVAAQVGVIAGPAGWLPLAAPALWAMGHAAPDGPITPATTAQLAVSVTFSLAFAALTVLAWSRLQLRR
ncbi:ABC transporter permease [Streptomyces albidoflavus]|uniref:ABC transporter permease n=1 Tax=Streptomyces albidoflavus TaxID=1886 RepID=UPI00332C9AD1